MFKLHKIFLPEVFLAFAGLGFSSSKSSTSSSSSTTNNVTDNRAAASEGSIAAGAGATVNVESSDSETVAAAGDAIARVAESANDAMQESVSNVIEGSTDQLRSVVGLGRDVVGAGVTQTRDALSFGSDALDFGERALQIATNAANQSQARTNDLIQRTNEQFTAKLAANAGDAPQAVAQDAIKYGAIALVALVGIVIVFRPSGKTA